STTYDMGTGFVTSTNAFGVVTTFEPTDRGNLYAITDANGHRTWFSYQWGVLENRHGPLVTSSRAIDSSGVVLSSSLGSLTTTYQYDAGLRLKRVQPPNANATVYEYDDLNQGWMRIERGPGQTSYQLDGFGRVVQATNRLNLKTRTTRDACG